MSIDVEGTASRTFSGGAFEIVPIERIRARPRSCDTPDALQKAIHATGYAHLVATEDDKSVSRASAVVEHLCSTVRIIRKEMPPKTPF
jgi:hypothetical protein